jgi:hypothetical protein
MLLKLLAWPSFEITKWLKYEYPKAKAVGESPYV